MKLSAFLVLAVATATTEAFVSRNIERTPTLSLQATKNHDRESENATTFANVALASIFSLSLLSAGPLPAFADGQTEKFKLPPVDLTDKTRCTLKSSSIGQANAARDKLYDLRQCKLSGESAVGFDLSGVIMTETDVSKVNFQDAVFSKGYLRDSNFEGADFSNAIVDRASFKGSSLRGAIFKNTVLTGTSFEGADVENADFTEAAIGNFDLKNLCKNPTLKGENPTTGEDTRFSVGCGPGS
ncbi:unnamed protein product [Pseudo-nitzschia multistriata]|uniref:Pentapeptide repeat protein n=1 Tax=Pseudo-nitzschia multistriata TaxID=183589 RepID=A0A448ZE67_9STRA|nr:unnamed protein product [Pseudo-nitzschia multistriata]